MFSENALYGEAPPRRPILYLFVYLHVVEKGYPLSSNRKKKYSCHFHVVLNKLNDLNDGRPFKYLNDRFRYHFKYLHLCNPYPFTLHRRPGKSIPFGLVIPV